MPEIGEVRQAAIIVSRKYLLEFLGVGYTSAGRSPGHFAAAGHRCGRRSARHQLRVCRVDEMRDAIRVSHSEHTETRDEAAEYGAVCYILSAVHRTASTFTIIILGVSTALMVVLPIVLGYAIWGIGGAMYMGGVAAAFWLIMGIQYTRVRRRRRES